MNYEDFLNEHDSATPWLGLALSKLTRGWDIRKKTNLFKGLTFVLTFLTYVSYHLSRKVISVVTPALQGDNSTVGWPPFNGTNKDVTIAGLDGGFLLAYAFGMYVSGHIAERSDLRYFLTTGMIHSGIFTAMFGLGRYLDVYDYGYFLVAQTLNGFAQSTGWPAVVPIMGNWFGYGKRGLILGIWTSHTAVGNILGGLIAGFFVDSNWGTSFVVPAAIITVVGVLDFLCLVPFPEMVFCTNPSHSAKKPRRKKSALVSEHNQQIGEDSRSQSSMGSSNYVLTSSQRFKPAISVFKALTFPGVIEYSMCLFFNKLVSYCFLYWLPYYIMQNQNSTYQEAANIAVAFDVGYLFGGISLGVISDVMQERSLVSAISIIIAVPFMLLYRYFGTTNNAIGIPLLVFCGMFVNGPYALITTAVSSDLGTHEYLRHNHRALSTVTSIIDGTGSLGAALGVFVCFILPDDTVFYYLVAANCTALLCLSRLLWKSVTHYQTKWYENRESLNADTL